MSSATIAVSDYVVIYFISQLHNLGRVSPEAITRPGGIPQREVRGGRAHRVRDILRLSLRRRDNIPHAAIPQDTARPRRAEVHEAPGPVWRPAWFQNVPPCSQFPPLRYVWRLRIGPEGGGDDAKTGARGQTVRTGLTTRRSTSGTP